MSTPPVKRVLKDVEGVIRTPAVQAAWDAVQAALARDCARLERLRREIGDDALPEHPERNPE